MDLLKLKKIILKEVPVSYSLSSLTKTILEIRQRSDYIVLYGLPTDIHWRGVAVATQKLFPNTCLGLPQHYSNSMLSEKDIKSIVKTIVESGFTDVIFSGFPPYFVKVVDLFNSCSVEIKLSTILHGTFTELGYGKNGTSAMEVPIQLFLERKLYKLAAVRKDVAESISKIWGVKTYEVKNKCVVNIQTQKSRDKNEEIKIGVFGENGFNKNLHNQVCSASLVNKAKIFVSDATVFSYLNSDIISIGKKTHHEFLSVLSQMDINLHLSFSESWGQIASESIALGVPCLVSANTNLLDDNIYLKQKLTVFKTDSPVSIANQIQEVLKERDELSRICQSYIEQLNIDAELLLNEFISA